MKLIGGHFGLDCGFGGIAQEAAEFGANAFALFTKPAVQWRGKVISEAASKSFGETCREHGFSSESILAHASYLLNMANPDPEKRERAKRGFIDEMKRCRQLGIKLLDFHPGSYLGGSLGDGIKHVSECLCEAMAEVPEVVPVIETMAGQGTNIGAELEEIRDIIAGTEDQSRVGVCIDTCHSFAAGYDIRSEEAYEKFMLKLDQTVGLSLLRGMHLNDSKGELGSRKDRHEHIGQGAIGMEAFKLIIRDKRTDGIPLILETPCIDYWQDEIALLKSFAQDASSTTCQ